MLKTAQKYDELVGYKAGQSKGDFVCDSCNESLGIGARCVAITLIPSEGITWQNDYVGETFSAAKE